MLHVGFLLGFGGFRFSKKRLEKPKPEALSPCGLLFPNHARAVGCK